MRVSYFRRKSSALSVCCEPVLSETVVEHVDDCVNLRIAIRKYHQSQWIPIVPAVLQDHFLRQIQLRLYDEAVEEGLALLETHSAALA